MSGQTEIFRFIIPFLAVVAILSDLIWGKLYNLFTVPLILGGLLASSFFLGWQGFLHSFGGIFLALFLFGGMFWLRFLGGGDVKYLMALGSWGGISFTLEVAFLAVMLGGVISLILLIFNGKIFNFLKKAQRFLLSVFIKELELQLITIDRTMTFPFGIPLSLAAVWVLFSNPFAQGGVFGWL